MKMIGFPYNSGVCNWQNYTTFHSDWILNDSLFIYIVLFYVKKKTPKNPTTQLLDLILYRAVHLCRKGSM